MDGRIFMGSENEGKITPPVPWNIWREIKGEKILMPIKGLESQQLLGREKEERGILFPPTSQCFIKFLNKY